MKKIGVLIITLLLLCGCSNDTKLKDEATSFIIDNTYSVIYNELDTHIEHLKMFPISDEEEKLIYYVQAVIDNHSKFSQSELLNLYNLFNFEYYFNFNEIDYTRSDYENDLKKIRNYTE